MVVVKVKHEGGLWPILQEMGMVGVGCGGPMVIVTSGSAGAAMLGVGRYTLVVCRCHTASYMNPPRQDVAGQEETEEDTGF